MLDSSSPGRLEVVVPRASLVVPEARVDDILTFKYVATVGAA
jgi:hypothetical protein